MILCRRLEVFLSMLISFFFPSSKKPKISLLIPFSSTDPIRQRNLKYLLRYWKQELPEAEIIIGESKSEIFSKNEALNNAVSKAKGNILVIMDADAYTSADAIRECAKNIIEYRSEHLWYVPYRKLYRINEAFTNNLLKHPPYNPDYLNLSDKDLDNPGDPINYGHKYGAMSMMFHRDAYKLLGKFDERFNGWGGEDICLLRALDTLYGKHKTYNNSIYHLWHPMYGEKYNRMWEGQTKLGINWDLSKRYAKALYKPSDMRKIINEYKVS
jgi:predicted glycosyltransferase involved in capsule biosynthesis